MWGAPSARNGPAPTLTQIPLFASRKYWRQAAPMHPQGRNGLEPDAVRMVGIFGKLSRISFLKAPHPGPSERHCWAAFEVVGGLRRAESGNGDELPRSHLSDCYYYIKSLIFTVIVSMRRSGMKMSRVGAPSGAGLFGRARSCRRSGPGRSTLNGSIKPLFCRPPLAKSTMPLPLQSGRGPQSHLVYGFPAVSSSRPLRSARGVPSFRRDSVRSPPRSGRARS